MAYTGAAPTTSPTASSFVLIGTGTDVREITLAAGTWTVAMDVSENVICIQTNVCVVEYFAIELESLDGTGLAAPANTYAGEWIGRAALRIGAGDRALTPGRQLVSITAAPMAEWILIFEAPADAAPTPSPTLSPDTGAGIVLTGTGTDAREITLAAGIWTGSLEVSGNETCVPRNLHHRLLRGRDRVSRRDGPRGAGEYHRDGVDGARGPARWDRRSRPYSWAPARLDHGADYGGVDSDL